jgi:uncharacterized protein YlxP (DUF503 family)
MFYGVARLEVLVPQSRSLKDNRAVVQRLRDRLSGRLGLAVAEVDHQDLRQRATIGVAVIALSEQSARNALQAARREAESDPRAEVIGCEVLVDAFEGRPDWELPGGYDAGEDEEDRR